MLTQCVVAACSRGRKVLENRQSNDEERLSQLEKELEETILCGEEADRNYEEVTSLARSLVPHPTQRARYWPIVCLLVACQ